MSRDESIDWFHGRLSRLDAEKILHEESHNSEAIFLVRESTNLVNNYVLSVIYQDEFYHYQIQQHGNDAFFSIDSKDIHHGLDELIEHYKSHSSNLCTKLDKFVKKGPPPTQFCRLGKANLLHRATKHNNLEVVKQILTTAYSLDAKDENGMTAIHLAAYNKVSPEILKMLIDKGATVMCRDSIGNTALHYACLNQCKEMVELLINANVNLIHTRNNETGLVPLHEAAKVGNMEIVKFLLSHNAASLPRATNGLFPSDLARDNRHIDVAEYLEKYYPQINTFSHKWHHGTLDREGARTLLLKKRNELYEKFKEEYPETENVYVNDSKEINDLISGLFLVRSSERNKGLDVITMLHDDDQKNIRNYVIQKTGKHVFIDDGPYLPSLEHLISYYMCFADGLPVKLSKIVEPIPKPPIPIPPSVPRKDRLRQSGHSFDSLSSLAKSPTSPSEASIPDSISPTKSENSSKQKGISTWFRKKKHSLPLMSDKDEKEPAVQIDKFNKSISFSTDFLNNNCVPTTSHPMEENYDIPQKVKAGHPPIPVLPTSSSSSSIQDQSNYFTESDKKICDGPEMNDNCIEEIYFRDPPKEFEMSEWGQLDPELYDTQKNLMIQVHQATGTNYYVSKEDLKAEKEIGSGEFGNVLRGIMRMPDGRKILVAIKSLHKEHYEENYHEFLREASVMIKLDNPYIVKLIGITKGPPIGLVQELLPLGSLANYLLEHAPEIDNKDIDKWASQIALGMEYLESKRFVHRDLASRNILLAAKDHCKISDFGLSRALGGEDFYQSQTGGRWPLKWYAPESYCGKFSHASDVWSFGITLWELYSRGETPYGDMTGMQVNDFIEKGQRLPKPEQCPDTIYYLMTDCWQYRDRLRPNFKFLARFFVNRIENPRDEEIADENMENYEGNDKHSNTVYV